MALPEPPPENLPEVWLRGPIEGVHSLTAPILYAFQQAREDLAHYTADLTHEQLWARPHGFGSAGFHIRHIAGSTGRLMSYLQGKALTRPQLAALKHEHDPMDRAALFAALEGALRDAEAVVRAIRPCVSLRTALRWPQTSANNCHRIAHSYRRTHATSHRASHQRRQMDCASVSAY